MNIDKSRRKIDNMLDNDSDFGPWDGKRYELMGLNGRKQYIIVDDEGVVVTFPDNKFSNKNYQSTATALARMVSIAMRAGINIDVIKKQLRESSMQHNDTPDLILTAMEKYANENKNKR